MLLELTLTSHGVAKNARIGLIFDRSPLAIASMLAVWKVAATYVPINPEAAIAQFTHILEDAAIQTVLVHNSTEAAVATLCKGTGEKWYVNFF